MKGLVSRRIGRGRNACRLAAHNLLESLESRTLFAVTAFQIDPTLSKISLSGDAYGIDLDSQDSGSLTAHYEGTIKADLTSTTIKFVGGSDIIAQSHGDYSPHGGPANYAGEAHGPFGINLGKVAIRDLTLDLTSSTITLADGAFPSTSEHLSIKTGTAAYDVKVGGSGDKDISDNDSDNVTKGDTTITVNAEGLTTLTIPFNVTFDKDDLNVHLNGKIVATAIGTTPIVDLNGADAAGRNFVAPFVVGQDTTVSLADPSLTVTDVDDTQLVSGKVTLGNRLDGSNERLLVNTGTTGITSSYDASTGVLTLSGNASLANYRTVLSTLQYRNNAGTPTVGDRSAIVTLNDGTDNGPAATATIQVTDPNVAIIGTGAAKSVAFTDADGSTVSVSLSGGGSATLHFAGATTQTASGKSLVLTGTNISLGSIAVTGATAKSKLTVKAVGGADGGVGVSSISSDAGLAQVGGKSVDLTGSLNVTGVLGRADFRNVSSATISAGTIGRFTAYGDMTAATLSLTDPFVPLLPNLGRFTVAGTMSNSRVTTAGNIGRVTIGSMLDSQIYAGRATTSAFPSAASDFTADAVYISRVTLGSKHATGAAFDGSVIAARSMGKVSLGLVNTDNGGSAFGIAADNVLSLSAKNPTGQVLKLKRLDDPTAAAEAFTASGFSAGDFALRIV